MASRPPYQTFVLDRDQSIDLDAARAYAAAMIRKIKAQDSAAGICDPGKVIEITDESEKVLLSIKFSEVM